MAVEPIFYGGTLSGRLIAVAARDDMTATMRLDALLSHEDEDVFAQREEAWTALSVGVEWAARALDTVGVRGTDTTPIGDSEGAFARGQHLGGQLFELSQLQGRHDRKPPGPSRPSPPARNTLIASRGVRRIMRVARDDRRHGGHERSGHSIGDEVVGGAKASSTRGKKAIRSFSMAYVGFRWARSPVWKRYEDRKWDRRRPKTPVFAGSLTVRPDLDSCLLGGGGVGRALVRARLGLPRGRRT
jgi:hypothetical protein